MHRLKTILMVPWIVMIFAFIPASNVFPQGNIHVGSLKVMPSLAERFYIDDNVFNTSGKSFRVPGTGSETDTLDDGKHADVYNQITPGLKLELPISERLLYGKIRKLSLDWHSDFRNYANNADLNMQNHFVIAGITFEILKGVDITLAENFAHNDWVASSERDRQHPRDTNTSSFAINLSDYITSLKRTDIEVKYENFRQDYKQDFQERANRMEHRLSLKVSYQLTPKLSVYPRYTHGITDFNRNSTVLVEPLSDSRYNEIVGGIKWLATAKTVGMFELGYRNRDYVRSEVPEVSTLVMKAGLKANFIQKTILQVDAFREQLESEFTGGSNAYIATGMGLSISRLFFSKLSVGLSTTFTNTDFYGSSRKDDIYAYGLGANYIINEWLKADCDYSYKDQNSNIDRESGRKNVFSFGLKANF